MIRAVIFDMDGVIIDSEPVHFESDKMTLNDYGIEITDDELNNYVGVSNPIMWSEIRDKYKLSCSVHELLEKQAKYKKRLFEDRKLEAIVGVKELLDKLKGDRIKIGLASSSSRTFIEMILSKLKIIEYFDVIISGEEVHKSKPSPDIFLKTAEILKLEPCDCLVIEDSEHGVHAAKHANMKCIGFMNPNSGKQDLSLSDKIVYSIHEVDCRKFQSKY